MRLPFSFLHRPDSPLSRRCCSTMTEELEQLMRQNGTSLARARPDLVVREENAQNFSSTSSHWQRKVSEAHYSLVLLLLHFYHIHSSRQRGAATYHVFHSASHHKTNYRSRFSYLSSALADVRMRAWLDHMHRRRRHRQPEMTLCRA